MSKNTKKITLSNTELAKRNETIIKNTDKADLDRVKKVVSTFKRENVKPLEEVNTIQNRGGNIFYNIGTSVLYVNRLFIKYLRKEKKVKAEEFSKESLEILNNRYETPLAKSFIKDTIKKLLAEKNGSREFTPEENKIRTSNNPLGRVDRGLAETAKFLRLGLKFVEL